jgi:magnesium-transporting ATPase (P-type)
MVLKCCDSWHNKSSETPSALGPDELAEIERDILNMTERAQRTLIIAYKRLDLSTDLHTKDELGLLDVEKGGLTLLAILGVRDIPRPEVPKAIADCKLAHVKVRIVTGDNLITAKAIAKEIGIIESGNTESIVM